jgi:hypothetical protein
MSRPANRLTLLLTLCAIGASGCGTHPTSPPDTLIGRFDAFWSTFDREYSYFDYKHIDWNALRDQFRPRAAAASSMDELVSILKEMVAPLRDVHVHFFTPAGALQQTYVPATAMNWRQDIWLSDIRRCAWTQVKPNLGYCLLNGIAYVSIGAWNSAQFSVADLDAVMDAVRNAPGMILDLRPNGGGTDALAFPLGGRFTSMTTVSSYFRYRAGAAHNAFGAEIAGHFTPRGAYQFTKPVIVLSGRGMYSTTEGFVSGMRELPNVTIVGDTTGGGSGNPGTYDLGDGWTYSVSRWIEWTVDRRVIEWQGIPPDVYVAWDSAAVAVGRDPVLDAALARLGAASPD